MIFPHKCDSSIHKITNRLHCPDFVRGRISNAYLVANSVPHRLQDSTGWYQKQKSACRLDLTRTLILIAYGEAKMLTRQPVFLRYPLLASWYTKAHATLAFQVMVLTVSFVLRLLVTTLGLRGRSSWQQSVAVENVHKQLLNIYRTWGFTSAGTFLTCGQVFSIIFVFETLTVICSMARQIAASSDA